MNFAGYMRSLYAVCTSVAPKTPKLLKKVLHIGDIALKNRDEIFDKKIGLFCPFWKTRVNLWWITVEYFDISGKNSFRGQFYHFENHVLPIFVHFLSFWSWNFSCIMHIGDTRQYTNCSKKCCTLGTMLHIRGFINVLYLSPRQTYTLKSGFESFLGRFFNSLMITPQFLSFTHEYKS